MCSVNSEDYWGQSWTGSGIGLTLESSDEQGVKATGGSDLGEYGGWFEAYGGVFGVGTGEGGRSDLLTAGDAQRLRRRRGTLIRLEIPGWHSMELCHLVLDLNGRGCHETRRL